MLGTWQLLLGHIRTNLPDHSCRVSISKDHNCRDYIKRTKPQGPQIKRSQLQGPHISKPQLQSVYLYNGCGTTRTSTKARDSKDVKQNRTAGWGILGNPGKHRTQGTEKARQGSIATQLDSRARHCCQATGEQAKAVLHSWSARGK